MFHFIQLAMSNISDRVTQLMEMKASSKEYLSLRKELTEDERVLLKKRLRKRSDTAYKLKRIANNTDTKVDKSKSAKGEDQRDGQEPIKANVSDHDLDLNKNVKIIKGIVSQMLNIMKRTNQPNSNKSSSTVTPKTEELIIDSYSTYDDNLLNKFAITVNRNP